MTTTADYLVELCRLHVLIALLLAAAGKSLDIAAFRDSLATSFPEWPRIHAALTFAILALEWGIVVTLLMGGTVAHVGMLAATGLFAVFTGVVVWSLLNGRTIVCSCFGATGHRMGAIDLVRNLLLTGTAAAVVLWPPSLPSLSLLQGLTLIGIASFSVFASVWLRDLFWLLRAKAAG